MNRLLAILACCTSLTFVGSAFGHGANANSDCFSPGSFYADETLVVGGVPVTATVGGTTYYVGANNGVYSESNNYPGLQTHSHTCTMKHDSAGNDLPKPWAVVTIPADSSL